MLFVAPPFNIFVGTFYYKTKAIFYMIESHSPPLCLAPPCRCMGGTNLGLYPPRRRSVEGGASGTAVIMGL